MTIKNGDYSAMPNQVNGGDLFGGLTKREQFAMAAMQGLLHNHHGIAAFTCADITESAVQYADALLAELERSK